MKCYHLFLLSKSNTCYSRSVFIMLTLLFSASFDASTVRASGEVRQKDEELIAPIREEDIERLDAEFAQRQQESRQQKKQAKEEEEAEVARVLEKRKEDDKAMMQGLLEEQERKDQQDREKQEAMQKERQEAERLKALERGSVFGSMSQESRNITPSQGTVSGGNALLEALEAPFVRLLHQKGYHKSLGTGIRNTKELTDALVFKKYLEFIPTERLSEEQKSNIENKIGELESYIDTQAMNRKMLKLPAVDPELAQEAADQAEIQSLNPLGVVYRLKDSDIPITTTKKIKTEVPPIFATKQAPAFPAEQKSEKHEEKTQEKEEHKDQAKEPTEKEAQEKEKAVESGDGPDGLDDGGRLERVTKHIRTHKTAYGLGAAAVVTVALSAAALAALRAGYIPSPYANILYKIDYQEVASELIKKPVVRHENY